MELVPNWALVQMKTAKLYHVICMHRQGRDENDPYFGSQIIPSRSYTARRFPGNKIPKSFCTSLPFDTYHRLIKRDD